ncbi:MAG: sodium-translocating pyrophosphatase [Candidatus Ratteibacteria bacterium]|nr:sodium-translocating pyrophosphatase [Candidatus Ratteibacteria bacterium]
MVNLIWLAFVGSIAALIFAAFLTRYVMKKDEGTPKMKEIAQAVKEGALAYIKRQYSVVGIFFAFMFLVLLFLAWRGYLVIFVPFAFLTGGFFSGLAGFLGLKISTQAGGRTAQAARFSLNQGLKVAFSSGAVMGLLVVGLGLLDLSIWYYLLDWYYQAKVLAGEILKTQKIQYITSTMLCFGMGASFQALFARVGGGIFTKAADVGADLVGKVEANIPEDDPRNAAVIADNVGDNVGDVAGMGADLYESYVGTIVAAAALGVAAGLGIYGLVVPMLMAAIGVVASIIGTFFIKAGDKAEAAVLLKALRRGIFSTAILVAGGAYFLIRFVLGSQFFNIYWAVLTGLLAGLIIGVSTEFFTSSRYSPTRQVAQSARSGPAVTIINGLAWGMLASSIPVITVALAILISYFASGGAQNPNLGLYGVGIAAVGMLSTLGMTLATDAYGPVADNAGGNAQMSGLPPEVRQRTDALDALGNTTAATGKGFAIGSAALTALALIAAYRNELIIIMTRENLSLAINLSLLNPAVICGLFIGGMLPFLFSSLTIKAVGRTAYSIVEEVRRQFREISGLMEGKAKADYARCVDLCTRAAQKEMVLPAAVAILSPILIGLLFGVEAVAGLLAGALICGFTLAITMANAGGIWDNAKKMIESQEGEKGTFAHKAAVVGDTVGDPLKDTAGPALNILIKLMSMVSIVFASFILKNSLFK